MHTYSSNAYFEMKSYCGVTYGSLVNNWVNLYIVIIRMSSL